MFLQWHLDPLVQCNVMEAMGASHIISTCNPYTINVIPYMQFLYEIFEMWHVFCSSSISQFRLATFQVFRIHTWQVATILGSTDFAALPTQVLLMPWGLVLPHESTHEVVPCWPAGEGQCYKGNLWSPGVTREPHSCP